MHLGGQDLGLVHGGLVVHDGLVVHGGLVVPAPSNVNYYSLTINKWSQGNSELMTGVTLYSGLIAPMASVKASNGSN